MKNKNDQGFVTELPEGFHYGWGYCQAGSEHIVVRGGKLLHRSDDNDFSIVTTNNLQRIVSDLGSELRKRINLKIKEIKDCLAQKEEEARVCEQVIAELQRLQKST